MINNFCHKKQFDYRMGDRNVCAQESPAAALRLLMFSACLPQIMMNVPQLTCASTGCVSTRMAASNVSASQVLCWLPMGATVLVRMSLSLVSALLSSYPVVHVAGAFSGSEAKGS